MNNKSTYQICPDENLLAQYVEGTLTGEKLRYVKKHLETCQECNETILWAMELNVGIEETPDSDVIEPKIQGMPGGGKFIAAATATGAIFDLLAHSASQIPFVAENNLTDHAINAEHHDSNLETNHATEMESQIHEAPNQFGEEAKTDVSSDVYQNYKDTCAIRSQQLILNDFGFPVTQEDLIKEALQNGWYEPSKGTSLQDVGNLLESHGITVNRMVDANIFNLTNELAQGHRVIIGVDANELWHNGFWQGAKDSIVGETPNHALIVAGIDTSVPNDVQVILKDPGTGDVAKAYPIAQFMDAWKDSSYFMVSTQEPVPPFAEGMENFDYAYLNRLSQIAGIPYPEFETFHQLSNSTEYSHDYVTQVYDGFNAVMEGEKFTDVLTGLIEQIHTPSILSNLTHFAEQLKDSLWFETNNPEIKDHHQLSSLLDNASVAHEFSEYFNAMCNFHSLGDVESNPFHNDGIANWYHEQI